MVDQNGDHAVDSIDAFHYPDLPITLLRSEIITAIQAHSVIIVAGETGSGKTTQLPKLCLEAGLGKDRLIGHTQPRRIAAKTVAMRIASELKTLLGHRVGYKIRFTDKMSPTTQIKLMTDGILLAETQGDPLLKKYDCIIIDEAHERSLNIDFILGYLKILLKKRPDMKVIITSATIEVMRFSRFFDDAPVINVSGRAYPVSVHYLSEEAAATSEDPTVRVLDAISQCCETGPGDILIFQSGEKEIREVCEAIIHQRIPHTTVMGLYGRQSASQQQKIFEPCVGRKIIVATNVAETSITVPNIRFVIDEGLARISRYHARSKLQRLPIEAISQASADQRKGRTGRVAPGICYRLYTEADFLSRRPFTEPEILRTHLSGVILKTLSLNINNLSTFPFIDPPDSRYIKDGFALLEQLGAVDERQQLTPIGRQLARIPIEPRLGRVLIAANELGVLAESLIMVSALTIVDPRERPHEFRQKADEQHRRYFDERSDFMSVLKLWDYITTQRKTLSNSQFRKLCQSHFISFLRVCEWADIHKQLFDLAKELHFKVNQVPAEYSLLHQALLSGFIDGIGFKKEKCEYLGARNSDFILHPSSHVCKKPPLWVMTAEKVHTTKTFGRYNAVILPEWLEACAGHLIKKQYLEPHFDEKSGRVIAYEKATLFGLDLKIKRRVNYEKISPTVARELFIQEALVQGRINKSFIFYEKNSQTLQQLVALEDRFRRMLILFDESRIAQFYDQVLPEQIHSIPALEKILKTHPEIEQSFIFSLEGISATPIPARLFLDFPESFLIQDHAFALSYVFDMRSIEDGVTLNVPLKALKFVKDYDFSWVVPGFLEEKIIFLLKSLPKAVRAELMPLPGHISVILNNERRGRDLYTHLSEYLTQVLHRSIPPEWLRATILPAHLLFHFRIIDDNIKIIASGDDLNLCYTQLKVVYPDILAEKQPLERDNITQWDFGDLPLEYPVSKNKLQFMYYPALVASGEISIRLFEDKSIAQAQHLRGVAQLYVLRIQDKIKYMKKNISPLQKKQLTAAFAPWGDFEAFLQAIAFSSCYALFVESAAEIRSQACFEREFAKHSPQVINVLNQYLQLAIQIFSLYHTVKMQLAASGPNTLSKAYEQISSELKNLLYADFITATPFYWLRRFPIYLKAMTLRLEKLPRLLIQDQQLMTDIMLVEKQYLNKPTLASAADTRGPLFCFRWLLQEWRVSCFAQSLGTIETVSKVRLLKLLEQLN